MRYATESYNSDTNTYSRHGVGTEEEMMSCLTNLVKSDVSKNVENNYYRIVKVSDTDLQTWNRQVSELPDVPVTDYIFGDWTQINVASKYLGVTFGRVFNLVTAGEIAASTTEGRNKLVKVSDVVDRRINKRRPGRPPKKHNETSEVCNK